MTIKQFFKGLSYMFAGFSTKIKIVLTVIVSLFALSTMNKVLSPSPDGPQHKATAGKIENQQSTPTKPDYESDLEERCKDWLFYRNRAYKLGREGDQKGAEQARRAMNQFYNDLKLLFSEKQISDEIARLEAAGFKGGF
jgi:hypothetical protein